MRMWTRTLKMDSSIWECSLALSDRVEDMRPITSKSVLGFNSWRRHACPHQEAYPDAHDTIICNPAVNKVPISRITTWTDQRLYWPIHNKWISHNNKKTSELQVLTTCGWTVFCYVGERPWINVHLVFFSLFKENWGIIYKEWNVYHLISPDKCLSRHRPYPEPLEVSFVPFLVSLHKHCPSHPRDNGCFNVYHWKLVLPVVVVCVNGVRDLRLLTRDRAVPTAVEAQAVHRWAAQEVLSLLLSRPCCCIHQQFITTSLLKKSCTTKSSTKNTCHIIFTHVHLVTQTNVFKIQIYSFGRQLAKTLVMRVREQSVLRNKTR